MNIAKRLKELRVERNKTQKEVAKYLGLTRQAYNRYEMGQREPSLENLEHLAKYYQVSPQVFFLSNTEAKNLDVLLMSQLGALYEYKYRALDDIILYLEINEKRQDLNFIYREGHTISEEKIKEWHIARDLALKEFKKIKKAILKRLEEDEAIEKKANIKK